MVLLVDEDENVLNFIREALEKNGYKVIATTNPMSAIDAFTKMHREISLVITDVVMPLIDGRELMKRIADIDPQTRFLTISGYSRYSEKSDDVKPDFFRQKPFDKMMGQDGVDVYLAPGHRTNGQEQVFPGIAF